LAPNQTLRRRPCHKDLASQGYGEYQNHRLDQVGRRGGVACSFHENINSFEWIVIEPFWTTTLLGHKAETCFGGRIMTATLKNVLRNF
jgi:hypothetical protein